MNSRASAVALVILGLLLLAPLLAPWAAQSPALHPRAGVASGIGPSALPSPGPQPLAATVSLALTTSTRAADPKDPARFTVYFNNTGDQAAPSVWINFTAPGGLLFQGDTAAGNASGYPRYRFDNLGLGLHEFQISFIIAIGTAPGSLLTLSATMVYSDGTGAQRFVGPATASVLVGVVTKQLYLGWSASTPGVLSPVPPTGGLLSQGTFTLTKGGPAVNFDLVPALARPFRALNVTAVLYVQPVSTPTNLDMNLTLIDVNGAATNAVKSVEQVNAVTGSGYWTLFYTFPSMNYLFSAGHQIRLQVLNTAASGQSALLATNATAEPSRISVQTTTYVTVDSLAPPVSPPTYLSPKSSLVVTANVSDPFGSREIVDARLNLTGPSGAIVTWLSLLPAAAVDPSSPSAWKLFRYTRAPSLANGTYSIELTAIERNGVVDVAAGSATVRAPAFAFQKVSSVTQAKSGVKFTYSLWYNNTGTGPAGTVWVNDTLPSQVNFLSTVPTFTSSSGSTYRWVLPSVAIGAHVIQMNVQVKGGVSGVGYIRNWASLNFSDEHGFLWPAQISHADVVLNGPFLTLGVTSAPAGFVHSNQPVVYTINLTNSGDAANTIWLNVTLPSGLAYVGDTSASLGGTRTVVGNTIRFIFSNMPSGSGTPVTWAFTMTARAAAGLPWGTMLTSHLALNDTSATNLLMPEQSLDFPLTVASPSISAGTVSFGVPAAAPLIPLSVYVNFTNSGNEPASPVWINLTLDPFLRFSSSPLPSSATNRTVHLTMSNAATGADSALLYVVALVNVTDRQVLSVGGGLAGSDGFGNPVAPVSLTSGSVAVALPRLNFTLSPGATTAEAGSVIRFTITGGNTGSGAASAVWLNLTLPSTLDYLSDSLGAGPVVLGSSYSWHWTTYAPGVHTYFLNLTAGGSALDRTSADLTFSVQAFDLSRRPQPVATFGGRVGFLSPMWLLSITPNRNTTLPGGTCNYTVRVENVGSTAAHFLWLTLNLDANLVLITHTAPVPAAGTTTLNWTFQDVQPGQVIAFNVLVKVAEGTSANTPIAEFIGARYTNSVGTVLGYMRSSSVQIQVGADLLPLLFILVGGSLGGAAVVVVVYRRYRVRIEDVFLISRNGILLSHLTPTPPAGKDEDVLSGMLTAVQDFVQDAFTYGEHRELHQLEFGDYHVLIERGKSVYLAVVYQGRDSGLIRKRVRAVLDRIESSYGDVFTRWEGDMQQVEGTREMLRKGFVEVDHPWSLLKPKAP